MLIKPGKHERLFTVPKSENHRSTRAMAFDRGQAPVISLVNCATASLGVTLPKLAAALQKYVDLHFGPAWDCSCTVQVPTPANAVPRGTWGLVLFDDADQPGVLGYHDLTADMLPIGKVFVKTLARNGESLSVTTSHELGEMLANPPLDIFFGVGKGVGYCCEPHDPVQGTAFLVDGLPMANFVLPAWFDEQRKPGETRFDYLAKCKRPLEILPGGYQIPARLVEQPPIFGSKSRAARFAKDDRRGHRSELRKKKYLAAEREGVT